LQGQYKCNTDDTSKGNSGQTACSSVYKKFKGEVIGCFAQNIGIVTTLVAEIMGVILAIECASNKHWNCLWLECDSQLVS
jgi:ribonuclease HI